jgi:hypothetical protein
MKIISMRYCQLCWQEFDSPSQHDVGSYHDKERLNGFCPGTHEDFRLRTAPPLLTPNGNGVKSPSLDLDQGEPIKL